ncbi:MAG: tol-pal system-associated acyl-CoA thioesterase [Magnetococcales bacterium]|nr:tol-pal system-associated acyl-CoA thioesterase [Magnetococcales bacterium]
MRNTPFLWPVRVYYEDTDAAGVVYHNRYLAFMERARTEWLRSFGIGQEELVRSSGLRFAVTEMQIAFLSPARLDEALTVSVARGKTGHASFWLHQEVTHAERKLIRAEVRLVCINEAFKPVRLPGFLQEVLIARSINEP